MGTYILTEKIEKILRSRGYNLICKYCECPILVRDEVESKQQRRGKSKLYHKKCYEDSHHDIQDESTDEELKNFFKRPILTSQSYGSEVISCHFEYPSIKSRLLSFINELFPFDEEKCICKVELARSQRKEDDDFYDVFSLFIWEKVKSARREIWIVKSLIEEHVT